jgi:LmbE family N-acetylglucosaminyl deacetylase
MAKWQGAIPRQLSSEDKTFIKLVEQGSKKASAFREAYPNHPMVVRWKNSEPGSPDHQRAMELIIAAAKNKLQAKYMRNAIVTYQDKMEQFSDKSIDTAIDLVENARSEKVRADLAIEGIRHKIGTPVNKVAVQERKTVILTFGEPPAEEDFIEGEIVSSQGALDEN